MAGKDTVDGLARTVGERVKTTRTGLGWTVRDLAEASGLSPNTVSLIERAEISPTVATLHKLATALDVPLAFLVEAHDPQQVIFQKHGQRPQGRSVGVSLENLGSGLQEQTIEPLLLTLDQGADSGPDPIVHEGHELVFCLEGCLEYQVDDKEYRLETNDSLVFEAALPHRWRNGGPCVTRALLVIEALQRRDVGRRRHRLR